MARIQDRSSLGGDMGYAPMTAEELVAPNAAKKKKKSMLSDALNGDIDIVNQAESSPTLQEVVSVGAPSTQEAESIPRSFAVPSEEMAIDRKRLGGFVDEALGGMKQFDSDKVNKAMTRIYETYAPGSERDKEVAAPFEAVLAKLNKDISSVREEQKGTINQNQWMQVAEQMGHALTQFGAGLYGLKHGVDLTGVKFDRHDWAADLKNRLGALDNDVADLRLQELPAREGLKESRNLLKDQANREAGIYLTGEKEDVEQSRNEAKMRLNAGMQLALAEMRDSNAAVSRGQALAKQADSLDRQQAQKALQLVDKEYKDNANKIKSLDDVISIQQGIKDGNIREDAKGLEERLAKAMANAGLDTEALSGKLNPPDRNFLVKWFSGPDRDSAINYLKGLKGKLTENVQSLDSSHEQLYQSVTGQARPAGMRANFLTPQQDKPAASSPQPGEVKGGYRFKGGNPADKANWEKV